MKYIYTWEHSGSLKFGILLVVVVVVVKSYFSVGSVSIFSEWTQSLTIRRLGIIKDWSGILLMIIDSIYHMWSLKYFFVIIKGWLRKSIQICIATLHSKIYLGLPRGQSLGRPKKEFPFKANHGVFIKNPDLS